MTQQLSPWSKPGILGSLYKLKRDSSLDSPQIAARLSAEFNVRITKGAVRNKLIRLGRGLGSQRGAVSGSAPANAVERTPASTITLPRGYAYQSRTLYRNGAAVEARPA